MPNPSITKIEELFETHGLDKPVIDVDYWKLPHGNKFVMLHTAYEKLAIKANVIFTQTNWLCAGADGMFVCEVSGYLRKDAENVQWSVGEANSVNYPAPTKGRSYYPACIAEKRGKDRVIGKLLQLSQLGIMSEMEDQAFANPEKDERIAELQQQLADLSKDKPVVLTSTSTGSDEAGSNGVDAASLAERQQVWVKVVEEAKVRWPGVLKGFWDDGSDEDSYKQQVHDRFCELFGDSGLVKENAYRLFRYPQNSAEAKQVLEGLPVALLNQAYKELFPDLVDEG